MKKMALAIAFLVLLPLVSFAQADLDSVNIRVLVGEDVTSPTTPSLLSVDPVAATQIDVSWSAATDDFAVFGYVVQRDGVGIATTSLTSYSDTSLAASTSYAYSVRAFDALLNYSTTSNEIATTTLDLPIVPPSVDPGVSEDGGGEGLRESEATIARVVMGSFLVQEGFSTTSFLTTTVRPARLEVRWGRTGSYELGYVVSNVFSRNHSILLSDLEPGTVYEFEVVGITPSGAATTNTKSATAPAS